MSTADLPVQSASPYKDLLARHPLVFFFIFSPTPAHGSLRCRIYFPKMGLASCPLVVLC